MKYKFGCSVWLVALLCTNFFAVAQQQLKSTKLLKDTGIDELYQVSHTSDGFVCIGMKGDDALNKKLWLLKLDEKMQVVKSEILANQTLSDPFKVLHLGNGNTLILAQLDDNNVKKSILFSLDKSSSIRWAKSFDMGANTHFFDMVLDDKNEIVFVGKQYMKGMLVNDKDQLVVMKTTIEGFVQWTSIIDMGQCELNPKNIFVDNQHQIVINGTKTELPDKNNNEKAYNKKWFAIKMNAESKEVIQLVINGFANYNFASNLIAYNGGYLVAINSNDYFGEPAIVELSNDLNVKNSFTFDGATMLLSGLTYVDNKIIVAGVFSNTFHDYSPGYIMHDVRNNTTIAKSSPSLFKHFFITNVLNLPSNQFMLSGIGYNENEASDVYMLPFTSDGNSACNLNTYQMNKKTLDLKSEIIPVISNIETAYVITQTLDLVKSESGYEMADICTAPDDYIIDPNKNKSWSDWKGNNKSSFEILAPKEWLDVNPNPAHDKVTVTYKGMAKTDALRLTILSSNSKIIYSEIIRNQDIFDVDITSFATGTYFFNLYDGQETQVKKVVKD